MIYTITKDFTFSASHQLHGLPDDHPCSRLHGHNYTVRIKLAADYMDGTGFIWDYRALDPFKQFLDEECDHRHLNEVFGRNPTAENLAGWLLQEARAMLPAAPVVGVGVSETAKTWAWCTE